MQKKLIQIIAPNPHHVPDGRYTAIFNHAYDVLKYRNNGTKAQRVLDLEFLVELDPNEPAKRIKKSYPLPNNRVAADLRRYLGDDFAKIQEGTCIDLIELNKFKGRCAELEVINFQGENYDVPFSSVKEFYPCILNDEEANWEDQD